MDDNLTVQDAVVHFQVKDGLVKAVDHVNARFAAGEITGLIGESGCGKSVLGMAILGLLPAYARTEGAIWLNGQNLLSLDSRQMRKLRGRKLGLIPQNPADSFNPVRKSAGRSGRRWPWETRRARKTKWQPDSWWNLDLSPSRPDGCCRPIPLS
ncbi:ABC transporter ATP-binding protein [Hungatella hathewayi]|nr:ABC transporter ATP-binding protein [Hungatella hathewayi]